MRLAPKFSLYALRHTWMNRLLTRGVDALTVAFLRVTPIRVLWRRSTHT